MITFLNINLNLEIIAYVFISLAVLVIILLIWNIRLEIKLKKLMRGKRGTSLEESFFTMQKDLRDFENFKKEMEKYLLNIEKRLSTSIRGFQNVSFNAFHGLESGGKSFAAAFLNENGDGIILSSLQARDRLSLFAKDIKKYKTAVDLSEEEQSALTKARESCKV